MQSKIDKSLSNITKMLLMTVFMLAFVVLTVFVISQRDKLSAQEGSGDSTSSQKKGMPDSNFTHLWEAPAEWRLQRLSSERQHLIQYGKSLIANTSEYFGPNGKLGHSTNGMNCQNCHLQAGTKAWGNNYFSVSSTYPKFRARSGTLESKEKRINDCFERSLNGEPIDSTSTEMRAIIAYMDWLGVDVMKKHTAKGSGIYKLKLLSRAAEPSKGALVYAQKCQSCHQFDGKGVLASDHKSYTYPPLWGEHSYNTGAGLYRLSNLAGYVKLNMPFGASYQNSQLSDEEAWDVAAYINSQFRPSKDLSKDWPKVAEKPFDHPFGPYSDPFSETQHKFGPFKEIKDWRKSHEKTK